MFVQEFSNNKSSSSNVVRERDWNQVPEDHVVPDGCVVPEDHVVPDNDPSYDRISLDLDLIAKCCPPVCCRNDEIRELPLNVLLKTVANWLEAIGTDGLGKVCYCTNRSDSVFSGNSVMDSGYSELTRPNSVASVGESIISGKSSCSFSDGNLMDTAIGRDSRSSSFGSARAKSVTFEDSMEEDLPKEYHDLVTLHLPIILRFCLTCPCPDVREKCQYILEAVQNQGLPVPVAVVSGPSAHVPYDEERASELFYSYT